MNEWNGLSPGVVGAPSLDIWSWTRRPLRSLPDGIPFRWYSTTSPKIGFDQAGSSSSGLQKLTLLISNLEMRRMAGMEGSEGRREDTRKVMKKKTWIQSVVRHLDQRFILPPGDPCYCTTNPSSPKEEGRPGVVTPASQFHVSFALWPSSCHLGGCTGALKLLGDSINSPGPSPDSFNQESLNGQKDIRSACLNFDNFSRIPESPMNSTPTVPQWGRKLVLSLWVNMQNGVGREGGREEKEKTEIEREKC
ncbi:hypothetical protein L345_08866, partial [Ophiophagus hannah]